MEDVPSKGWRGGGGGDKNRQTPGNGIVRGGGGPKLAESPTSHLKWEKSFLLDFR